MEDDAYTRDTVIELLGRLSEELRGPKAEAWENTSALEYLDALGRWLRACRGYYRNNFDRDPPSNAWRILYDALEAARTYE